MDAQIRKRAGICMGILLLLAFGSLAAIVLRIGAAGAPRQEVSGQGDVRQDPSGRGTAGQNPSGRGTAGQNPSGQGTAGQDPSGQGTAGQDPSGQGAAGQDPSGQGSGRAESSGQKLLAEIYQDGVLVDRIDLNAVDSSYQLEYSSQDGGRNVVEVSPGRIRILEADCPDKLCVKQGFLPDSLLPLVCLPHRLVIQLASKTAIDDSPEVHASGNSGAPDSGTSDSATLDTEVSDSSELDAIVH